MKNTIRIALLASTVLAMPLGATASSDQEALMQVSRDWSKAAATGNVDAMVSYWADDAVVMPPGQAALSGKAAIRAYVESSLKIPGFTISWEPQSASVQGGQGYLIEKNRVTFTGEKGELVTVNGKAVTVWRKNADGQWKCVVDIWNDDAPPAPATAPSR